MAKPITNSELIKGLSKRTGITEKTVRQLFDELSTIARKEAKNGFTIPGIGTLLVKNQKPRMGRDLHTGERSRVPAKREVPFLVAATAREAILSRRK